MIALTPGNSLLPRNHISGVVRVSAMSPSLQGAPSKTYPVLMSKRMTKRAAMPGGDSIVNEYQGKQGFREYRIQREEGPRGAI